MALTRFPGFNPPSPAGGISSSNKMPAKGARPLHEHQKISLRVDDDKTSGSDAFAPRRTRSSFHQEVASALSGLTRGTESRSRKGINPNFADQMIRQSTNQDIDNAPSSDSGDPATYQSLVSTLKSTMPDEESAYDSCTGADAVVDAPKGPDNSQGSKLKLRRMTHLNNSEELKKHLNTDNGACGKPVNYIACALCAIVAAAKGNVYEFTYSTLSGLLDDNNIDTNNDASSQKGKEQNNTDGTPVDDLLANTTESGSFIADDPELFNATDWFTNTTYGTPEDAANGTDTKSGDNQFDENAAAKPSVSMWANKFAEYGTATILMSTTEVLLKYLLSQCRIHDDKKGNFHPQANGAIRNLGAAPKILSKDVLVKHYALMEAIDIVTGLTNILTRDALGNGPDATGIHSAIEHTALKGLAIHVLLALHYFYKGRVAIEDSATASVTVIDKDGKPEEKEIVLKRKTFVIPNDEKGG